MKSSLVVLLAVTLGWFGWKLFTQADHSTDSTPALTSADPGTAPSPAPRSAAPGEPRRNAIPPYTPPDPTAPAAESIAVGNTTPTRVVPYPPMSLENVLLPGNIFHDAVFGVSVLFPDGWTVKDARRWGTNNRENTVFLETAQQSTASPSMYYQKYPEGAPKPEMTEAYLRSMAQFKETSRIGAGISDYRNVPESFQFKEINGRPALTYFAVFTAGDQIMTEHFIRILGEESYVMFFTRGTLSDVQPILQDLDEMAITVQVP